MLQMLAKDGVLVQVRRDTAAPMCMYNRGHAVNKTKPNPEVIVYDRLAVMAFLAPVSLVCTCVCVSA